MGAIVEALKSLKAWQIGTLAALLAATAAGTFGVYAVLNGSDEAGLGENQQLIPVRSGNLANEVSVNGSLVFPTREALTFGSQGLVKDVLVEEGQGVEAGQPLASLDDETVARLDKDVAQARVSLEETEDALALSLDPHTARDMATAGAAVADARLALRDAQDALDDLLTPSQVDVANAEATLVASQLALETARLRRQRIQLHRAGQLLAAEAVTRLQRYAVPLPVQLERGQVVAQVGDVGRQHVQPPPRRLGRRSSARLARQGLPRTPRHEVRSRPV